MLQPWLGLLWKSDSCCRGCKEEHYNYAVIQHISCSSKTARKPNGQETISTVRVSDNVNHNYVICNLPWQQYFECVIFSLFNPLVTMRIYLSMCVPTAHCNEHMYMHAIQTSAYHTELQTQTRLQGKSLPIE